MSRPAAGQWWLVILPDTGARMVALATAQADGMLRWDVPAGRFQWPNLIPVRQVETHPDELRLWDWWVVVDPATRTRSTARLVPLLLPTEVGLGWEVPEHDDALPMAARLPLWPLQSR